MMDHLLNLYPFTSTVWEWVASIFRHTDRDRLSIPNTLKNWKKKFSGNEIINKSWTLVPGFFIWDVWKEHINIWNPPPHGSLKVNIDGASKENPGLASFGGVIRDEQGQIKEIFHGHLGKATNNMEELMALEQCLEISVDSNSHNVIIEADSELIIRVAKNICNGTSPDKVSKHWRLS
eukprot:PITA_15014